MRDGTRGDPDPQQRPPESVRPATPAPDPDPGPLERESEDRVPSTCPACGAPLAPRGVCRGCGHDLIRSPLFDPAHFVWQSLLFSFLVPAWLAAINWGRLGRRRLRWGWIAGGALGLLGFGFLLASLPDRLPGMLHPGWFGWILNAPIGILLRRAQARAFAAHRAAGGSRASMIPGVLFGLGGAVPLLLVALGLAAAWNPDPAARGVRLLDAGRCTEAEAALRAALGQRPDDLDARYNLALSLVCQARSDQAKTELALYLAARPDDATAHAWMAMLFEWEGDRGSAIEHARIADTLDPGITRRLFGEDGDLVP